MNQKLLMLKMSHTCIMHTIFDNYKNRISLTPAAAAIMYCFL